ncbi:MAG: hypothetical protein C4520_14685 [Candidatus Abyssobacteria bacterium SURF_5]|jgi:4-amino-4-deoxy-L-arabinose transferase-like glycosyltransferase|uniref:Uncharacterized protein n=1 Tax=Abyssobacteria bacterium (strain SURF_5) TaxID=2093360 RepID=A0A3A4NFS0_ABYX5|nr:MAG: hypothetical protein C4520_14685 [Candidatus Abyssubacteria bacterium SURF_5]
MMHENAGLHGGPSTQQAAEQEDVKENKSPGSDTPNILPLLLIAWILFLTKGFLYSSITPLWEGVDEPFHFAYVHSLAAGGSLPVWGETFVDADIAQSTAYLPLPPLMPQLTGESEKFSYLEYWRMQPERRQELRRALDALQADADALNPSSARLYQVQHPPLYYLLCVPVLELLNPLNLVDKVYALRLFSVFLASLSLLAAAPVAKRNFSAGITLAALAALWPVLYIDVARVGNDSLGAAIFSLLFCALVFYSERKTPLRAALIGALLGLGLLTKAYFLTAIPAIAVSLAILAASERDRWKRPLIDGCIIFASAAAIGGWWYVRNYMLYGTFSGLQESIYFPSVGLIEKMRATLDVSWPLLIKHLFVTFSWVSGWSFLHLPKPAYLIFAAGFILAAAGLVKYLLAGNRRKEDLCMRHALVAAGLLFLFFSAGVAYHQVNVMATVKVMGGPGGWYFYALVIPISFVAAFAVVKLQGALARWAFLLFSGALFVVELFGFFSMLLPYYAGFAVPAADGWGVAPANAGAIPLNEALWRLLANKPDFLSPSVLAVSAATYIILYLLLMLIWSRNTLVKASS